MFVRCRQPAARPRYLLSVHNRIYFNVGFQWDDANLEHIMRHGVRYWEVEEAFEDNYALRGDAKNVRGERREAILGATQAGRILLVIYTRRGKKIRPITAREAKRREKHRYRKELYGKS